MPITKATHCKECKEEFNDIVKKYRNHAMCYDCYLRYQRKRHHFMGKEQADNFKITNRREIYKKRSEELKKCKSREEWLPIIQKNLEEAITEIKKQLI